jgi:hypothetical protein
MIRRAFSIIGVAAKLLDISNFCRIKAIKMLNTDAASACS